MSNSFLEALKIGLWEFRPHTVDYAELEASETTPGTREKLDVLAEHMRHDMPLWRGDDFYDEDRAEADPWRPRKPR